MVLVCAMPRTGICIIHYPPGYVRITEISRFTTRFRHLSVPRWQSDFYSVYPIVIISDIYYLSTSVVIADVAVIHVPLRRRRITETAILRYRLTAFVLRSQRELIFRSPLRDTDNSAGFCHLSSGQARSTALT